MATLKLFSLLTLTLGLNFYSYSQEEELLTSIPTTKEEFVKSEQAVINTTNWLENTPFDRDVDKRKQLNATFVAWITNSPTVTIELNSKTVPFTKKNNDLLIIFMGGWTRYCLQNGYSQDAVKCTLAGLKSVIKVYQMGNGLKKDKQIEKLIELDAKNELETWIAEQLGKK
jgi:hypothetical protein